MKIDKIEKQFRLRLSGRSKHAALQKQGQPFQMCLSPVPFSLSLFLYQSLSLFLFMVDCSLSFALIDLHKELHWICRTC